ncbi:hypothetical protein B0T11DRAFT_124711 [Plectosphaerella cucumerina]|uniref:DUF4484 domain-containing protein n=1 Tax=Plectosphaerella cucumerina TaxID=40658 RepID=A0A8K0TD29_9PEZI|nr:hypothetical protein B0T11DRAFT_124711 [Plectosphaerella cucumerina]
MASSRRGQPPLTVRLPPAGPGPLPLPDLPPVSALFLIEFDVKAGYTIAWKQAEAGIDLEGLVEYKSLPSGLHTVSDDLIYFVHERSHAGLSAFVNVPCDEEDARNARMLAVGLLVPLSEGRLGRAWRHAQALKELAATVVEDRARVDLLEAYWEKTRASANSATSPQAAASETPLEPPLLSSQTDRLKKGHNRSRSASDGAALIAPGHRLSPFHPAWSLVSLLDTFGPLIFPIHRAALLRKRILISCHTPVHEVCDFVYNLSVLSNIPHSVTEILDPAAPSHRLRPLFSIGVHDISFLLDDYAASKKPKPPATDSADPAADEAGTGWIACTTDSILAMKDTLWDMLITLPPAHSSAAREKVWPTVECPRGVPVKATQRDLRRFRALRSGLARLNATTPHPRTGERSPSAASDGIKLTTGAFPTPAASANDPYDTVVEPVSWAALAYSGFLWWASAGEQGRSDEHEEAALDASLLADIAPNPGQPNPRTPASAAPGASLASLTKRRSTASVACAPDDEAKTELAIIAYFHRLTTQILSVMADVVEGSEEDAFEPYSDDEDGDEPRTAARAAGSGEEDDREDAPLNPGSDEDEDEDPLPVVRIDSHAVESMGLDVWNAHDTAFLKELAARYFAREARVEGKGVEVCGLRVC